VSADYETFQQPAISASPPRITPGVLVAWSVNAPRCVPHPVEPRVTIGRGPDATLRVDGDDGVSRAHCEVSFKNGRFTVRDLGSRYGTFANGKRVDGAETFDEPPSLRVGATLLECRADVAPFVDEPTCVEVLPWTDRPVVVSPHLRRAFRAAQWAADHSVPFLVRGETGSGKEHVARAFHELGPRAKGPRVAHSAANIPDSVAETTLFGSKRGAFTDAVDQEGLIQRADGGTLFLDELAELSASLQAKLLRVLETKEVTPLGGRATHLVDFALCAATDIDLEAAIAAGKFRNQPVIASGEVQATTDFVEGCLIRPWFENVRGLRVAITRAAQTAGTERPARYALGADDFEAPAENVAPEEDEPTRLRRMLREENGNAAAVARRLGVSKSTLAYRLDKYGIR